MAASWADFDLAFAGGESSRAAQARVVRVASDLARRHVSETVVLSTHGNLLALLLNAFDPAVNAAFWRSLTFPDAFELRLPPSGAGVFRRIEPRVAGGGAATRPLGDRIASGPFPTRDGWGWLYRAFERLAPPGGRVRDRVCRYFFPRAIERWRSGALYRALGVHLFGAVIPTGGIVVRRLTGSRMAPYTLGGNSVRAAREFYYRTCVFEALHLPFFLTMVVLAIHRAATGRIDLAVENTVVNVALNAYPIMHHRRTRTRITSLLDRAARRSPR